MRKAIIAAAVMALFSGAAFADGTEKAASRTPPPPLKAPQSQTYGPLPVIHYSGDTYDGMAVATQDCGHSAAHGTVACGGSYVVVGSVLHSETMPAYVETVAPVMIETGAWTGAPVAPVAPQAPKAHSCGDGHYCDHRVHKKSHKKHKETVTLGQDFTGGVGYNIPVYYPSTRAVIVSTSGGRSYVGASRRTIVRSSCGGCCR